MDNSVVFGNSHTNKTIQELLDTSSEDSDESFVFTGGNKHQKIILDTQFDFDDEDFEDFALAGNFDGVGNIETFPIPETQQWVIYLLKNEGPFYIYKITHNYSPNYFFLNISFTNFSEDVHENIAPNESDTGVVEDSDDYDTDSTAQPWDIDYPSL